MGMEEYGEERLKTAQHVTLRSLSVVSHCSGGLQFIEGSLSLFSLYYDVIQSHIRGHINLMGMALQRAIVTLKCPHYLHYPSYLQLREKMVQLRAKPVSWSMCLTNLGPLACSSQFPTDERLLCTKVSVSFSTLHRVSTQNLV